MVINNFQLKRILQGRLEHGVDLYKGLLQIIEKEGIKAGMVTGIGAVSKANIAYLNQSTKEYQTKEYNEGLEIVSLHGNISLKDEKVFLHLHATLSDKNFHAIGGHLLPGTIVYAFEFEIYELQGPPFERVHDPLTNLFIWK